MVGLINQPPRRGLITYITYRRLIGIYQHHQNANYSSRPAPAHAGNIKDSPDKNVAHLGKLCLMWQISKVKRSTHMLKE